MTDKEVEFYSEIHKITAYRFKEGFMAGLITGIITAALIGGIAAIAILH